jgi:hypothetical protein
MGLYKLHLSVIPNLLKRLRMEEDEIVKHGQLQGGGMTIRRKSDKALDEARWTNRKYLADLVFVCKCLWVHLWSAAEVYSI